MLGQIYLLLSPFPEDEDGSKAKLIEVAAALDQVLATGHVAAFLLRGGNLSEDRQRAWIQHLCPRVQERDCAFLVEDRVDLAAQLGCDGVHLSNGTAAVPASRQALGDDMIIGALCGHSRHDAIEAGESGADYVAFGLDETVPDSIETCLALLNWWQEMMTVPCVAFGARDFDTCRHQARAGADFLALDGIIWNHVDGPVAAVRELSTLLQER